MDTIQPPHRICIVMLGAVGDVVHTLPVVTALKRDDPARKISWILQPGPASLLKGHPDIDEIIIFRRSQGMKGFLELREQLRTRSFDITLAMQSYLKAGIIAAMVPSPVKLGYDRKRARDLTWLLTNRKLEPREERHHQDQFLEFAHALGVDPEPLEWKLGPWPDEIPWREQFRSRFDRPIASIVIGASRVEREWFADRWAEVITSLHQDFGLAPVLVGGRSPREMDAEQTITSLSPAPVTSTLGEPFRNLVSILECSALVLSINTGPLHMAVALNRPTISLNGFGNPKRVGPYRRFHDLMIDRYGDPGEDYPITPKNRPGRMQLITVDDVLAKVQLWQERYGATLSDTAAQTDN